MRTAILLSVLLLVLTACAAPVQRSTIAGTEEKGHIANNVEQDVGKSAVFRWYLKAAENGDSQSQEMVSVLYGNGEGVEKDINQAFAWAVKAALGRRDLARAYALILDSNNEIDMDTYLEVFRQIDVSRRVDKELSEMLRFIYIEYETQLIGKAKQNIDYLYRHAGNKFAISQMYSGIADNYGQSIYLLSLLYKYGIDREQSSTMARQKVIDAYTHGYSGAINELENYYFKDWKFLGLSSSDMYFSNEKNIRRRKDNVWIWILSVDFTSDSNTKVAYAKTYQHVDCLGETMAMVRDVRYKFDDDVESSVSIPETRETPETVVPGSIGEMIYQRACGEK
jgi:hypothetical protein